MDHSPRQSPPLPPNLERRLLAFLESSATGTVELNIKDGQILKWKVHEDGCG